MTIWFDTGSSTGGGSLAGAELTANKDQPGGYPGLDENGAINAIIISRYGTKAEIDVIVLQSGEFAITTDTHEMRVGDGATLGGYNPGLGSAANYHLSAFNTPSQNGTALLSLYSLAGSMTPNGSALGANNRGNITLSPGRYDFGLNGSLVLSVPYVNIVGIGGSECVTLVTSGTASGAIQHNADNVSLVGLTLENLTSGPALNFITNNSNGIVHKDIYLKVLASNTVSTSFPGVGYLGGKYTDCRTNGVTLYGGISTTGSSNAVFDRCVSSGQTTSIGSFGSSSSTLTYIPFYGQILNCKNNAERLLIIVQSGARVDGCRLRSNNTNGDTIRAVSGAIITRNTLIPNSLAAPMGNGYPIGTPAGTPLIYAAHNIFVTNNMNPNIVNVATSGGFNTICNPWPYDFNV